MMRRSTRREIFSSIGRFFAIFAIIAIGVAFFSGIRVTRDTMLNAGENYINEQNMFDFRIVSPLGATEAEVDRIKNAEGVLFAQGAYVEDALCRIGESDESVFRFHSLSENINKLKYVSGRAPTSSAECVLDARFFDEKYIGAVITVTSNNPKEASDRFVSKELTVVGTATSPYYLNYERGTTELGSGSVAAFAYLCEDAFLSEDGMFDEVFVDYDLKGEVYSDEYNDALELASDSMAALCADVFGERTDAKIQTLKNEIDSKENELNSSEQTFLEEKKKAEEQLALALAELDAAKAQYDKLDNAYKESGESLKQSKEQLVIAIENLEKLLSVAPDADVLEISYSLTKYKYQLDEVNAALEPLLLFEESSKEMLKEINDGYAEYYRSKETLESESAKTVSEIADAREEISRARENLSKEIDWKSLAMTRLYNTGYVCFENDTGIVDAIGRIFPLFFFAVAVLVTMTTMTRMIDEHRTQIGTFKALGLRNREIRGKYITYAGVASLFGCGAGFALGTKYLPYVIWQIYTMMYDFATTVEYVFDPVILTISLVASLVCSIGVTLYCLKRSFSAVPAELMRPVSPGNGGRIMLESIGCIWNRLSFLQKVTARNIFRYKKRMLMMILGIGGCTALLLTGFGMYDSICNIVDYQYEDVTVYDIDLVLNEDYTDKETFNENFADAAPDIEEYLPVYKTSTDVKLDGKVKSTSLLIPERSDMGSFVKLALDEKPIEFPKQGEIAISAGLFEALEAEIGDTLTLTDSKMNSYTFKLSAVFDNYVSNYVIMSPETYTEAGGTVGYNGILLNSKEGVDPLALGAKLSASEKVISVTVNEQVRERTSTMLGNMIYLILIVVISAGALAFVVLYNLTNINITERIREIATLRVLGYHKSECCKYIFRENNILTFVGSLIGIPLGVLLHAYCMAQVKVEMIRFDVQITLLSFVLAVVITMLFALFVNLFMRRKITAVEMASSLKSAE